MQLLHFILLSPPKPASLIGLIAIALLVWFGGPLLTIAGKTPLAGPILRSGVILCVVLGGWLWSYRSWIRAKRQNTQLIESLLSPSSEDTRRREGGLKDIHNALNSVEAFERLALDQEPKQVQKRPWFLLLGTHHAGKTALLKNSGINPNHYVGTGVTREYDWWFTSTGIPILEVPAPASIAYAGDGLGDGDGTEGQGEDFGMLDQAVQGANWKQFLSILAKGRSRQPVSGLVVAISLTDLMGGDESDLRRRACSLRTHLHDLQARLAIRVPCYVVFSKLDTMPGFNEYFQGIDLEDHEQVWGVTFPLRSNWHSVRRSPLTLDEVDAELDALVRSLTKQRIEVLANKRDSAQYFPTFQFPGRFSSICRRVRVLAEELLKAEDADQGLFLRGLYFTSSTTETEQKTRKSYFAPKVLREIVFKEAGLARSTRAMDGARRWGQRLGYPLLLVVVLSILGLWGTSLFYLQQKTEQIKQQVQVFEAATDAASKPIEDGAVLLAMLDTLDDIRGLTTEQSLWLKASGLYQNRRLSNSARRAYHRALAMYFLPSVQRLLEVQLRAPWVAPARLKDLLELYLMLEDPRQLGAERLKQWVTLNFPASMEPHVNALLRLRLPPRDLDHELIKSVRQRINKVKGR